MIYLLRDDYFGHQELARIRDSLGPRDLLDMSTSDLEGAKVTVDELVSATSAMPFLSEKRLVIVRGIGTRFESRGEAAGRTRRSSRAGLAESLAAWLQSVPDTTELVLLEPSEERSSRGRKEGALARAVEAAGGRVVVSVDLRDDELVEWALDRVRALGGSIRRDAASALARAVGNHLFQIDSEIAKLLTYADGTEIDVQMVRMLVTETREENVFALVDSIGRRDCRQALRVLHDLLQSGAAAQYILTMIVRQFRLLLLTLEAIAAVGHDQRAVAARLGMQPWQTRNLIEQARRFTMPEVESAYSRLLEADVALKTSQVGDLLALDLLVVELARPIRDDRRAAVVRR